MVLVLAGYKKCVFFIFKIFSCIVSALFTIQAHHTQIRNNYLRIIQRVALCGNKKCYLNDSQFAQPPRQPWCQFIVEILSNTMVENVLFVAICLLIAGSESNRDQEVAFSDKLWRLWIPSRLPSLKIMAKLLIMRRSLLRRTMEVNE